MRFDPALTTGGSDEIICMFCRGALRLVCKRWLRVADTSAFMCWDMIISPQTLEPGNTAAFQRFARRRAAVVRQARLPGVHLPGMLEAAQQLTSLTKLQLSASAFDPSAEQHGLPEHSSHGEELACRQLGLGGLTRLAHLELDVADLQAVSCAQLSTLTHLSAGTLTGQVPPELWAAVARMPRLAELTVAVHSLVGAACLIGSEAWAALRACTGLTRLELKHNITDMYEVGDGGLSGWVGERWVGGEHVGRCACSDCCIRCMAGWAARQFVYCSACYSVAVPSATAAGLQGCLSCCPASRA
jgi:hypothetical protein